MNTYRRMFTDSAFNVYESAKRSKTVQVQQYQKSNRDWIELTIRPLSLGEAMNRIEDEIRNRRNQGDYDATVTDYRIIGEQEKS